ncbi:MAG: 30S ribosomal protein S4 [Candidatus Woesearchaeota archaeon]|jgi:small subunit ribosomal protein S4
MGDPKKLKKKYNPLAHPWIRANIEEGKILKKEYGLTKYKEVLIASSFLKKYKDIAKRLIVNKTAQGEKEKNQMMDKLQRCGLIKSGAGFDEVLSIQLKDVLERRLQSLICRKGFARTMKQARQFITHRHVMVGEKEITSPGYLMTVTEENAIVFKPTSTLASVDHPERTPIVKAEKTPEQIKKEEAKREERERRSDRRPIKRKGRQQR